MENGDGPGATDFPAWDGGSIGPGPIAIRIGSGPDDSEDGEGRLNLQAWTQESGVIALDAQRLGEFLETHVNALLISGNVAEIHWRLQRHLTRQGDARNRLALWELSRHSRWIDVRLWDRLDRYARGDKDFRIREIEALRRTRLVGTTGEKGRSHVADPHREAPADARGELHSLIQLFAGTRSSLDGIQTDANASLEPPYVLRPLSPEEEEHVRKQHKTLIEHIIKTRPESGVASSQSGRRGSQERRPSRPEPELVKHETGAADVTIFFGAGCEARAAIAFEHLHTDRDPSGFRIDRSALPELRQSAEDRYRRASNLLRKDPKTKPCFNWDEESHVRLTKNGHPDSTKKLANWLTTKSGELCDAQNRPAPIPRDPNGIPTPNPAHWGVWPACDRTLWAWRDLHRMAEVLRLARGGEIARPGYESLPSLRSREPNLAVYRSLRTPVFRPRPGCVFLSGALEDLKLRCLSAVCLRKKYVPWRTCRLLNYILGEPDPRLVIARELYCARRRDDELRTRVGSRYGAGDRREFAEELEDVHHEALREFERRRSEDPAGHLQWLKLTEALVETAPLGLPNSLATAMLRLEYGLEKVNEAEASRLTDLLAEHVVYELAPFLEDRTEDTVGARWGMSANQVIRDLIDHDHPDTSAARLRNRLTGKKGRLRPPTPSKEGAGGPPRAGGQPLPKGSGADLFQYRVLTLGGRPTIRAGQATVRQLELLLAADEVMIAVAFAILADGWNLLGVAGHEFVVEAPLRRAGDPGDELKVLVQSASRPLLGELAAPVTITECDSW